MKRASFFYCNSEEALAAVCSGCAKETGWLERPRLETPECALDIIDDRDALTDRGECPYKIDKREAKRRERERREREEREKYERRMRGDWT